MVNAAIRNCGPDIVVIQETKKEVMLDRLVRWILGKELLEWCVVPIVGAAGSILCVWNLTSVSESEEIIGSHSISILLKDVDSGVRSSLVYP